jgi:hypothetical protein
VGEAGEDDESFETGSDSSLSLVGSDAAFEVLVDVPSELVFNAEVRPSEEVDCVFPVLVKSVDIPLKADDETEARLVESEVVSVTQVKVSVFTASVVVKSTPSSRREAQYDLREYDSDSDEVIGVTGP